MLLFASLSCPPQKRKTRTWFGFALRCNFLCTGSDLVDPTDAFNPSCQAECILFDIRCVACQLQPFQLDISSFRQLPAWKAKRKPVEGSGEKLGGLASETQGRANAGGHRMGRTAHAPCAGLSVAGSCGGGELDGMEMDGGQRRGIEWTQKRRPVLGRPCFFLFSG